MNKPALSAEQWREYAPLDRTLDHYAPAVAYDNAHGAAALALHRQPFGFTWDDVENVRESAKSARRAEIERRGAGATSVVWGELEDLADRIAAILPPGDAP